MSAETDAGVFLSFMNIISALFEGQKISLKETHTSSNTSVTVLFQFFSNVTYIFYLFFFFFFFQNQEALGQKEKS